MLPTFRVAVLVLLLAFYRAAFAEHHNHPPQDATLHEQFYSTWMRPDNPSIYCCNKQDCYPAEFKLVGATWFAKRREDGEWVPIRRSSSTTVSAKPPPIARTVAATSAWMRRSTASPTYGALYSGSVGDVAEKLIASPHVPLNRQSPASFVERSLTDADLGCSLEAIGNRHRAGDPGDRSGFKTL
jgi:hypothetical protein